MPCMPHCKSIYLLGKTAYWAMRIHPDILSNANPPWHVTCWSGQECYLYFRHPLSFALSQDVMDTGCWGSQHFHWYFKTLVLASFIYGMINIEAGVFQVYTITLQMITDEHLHQINRFVYQNKVELTDLNFKLSWKTVNPGRNSIGTSLIRPVEREVIPVHKQYLEMLQ